MRQTVVAAFGLALLLMPMSPAGAYEAEEIEAGADVTLHLRYEGGTTGRRAGTLTEGDSTRTLDETTGSLASWEATFEFANYGRGQLMRSQAFPYAEVSATRTEKATYRDPGVVEESTSSCALEATTFMAPIVTAIPEVDGLRVSVEVLAAANHYDEEGCHDKTETRHTQPAYTSEDEDTRTFERIVATLHAIEGGAEAAAEVNATFFMPYGSQSVARFGGSWPVPYGYDSPAYHYCDMTIDAYEWAPGSCTASGTLTATLFVDPCRAITRTHREHHDALLAHPDLPEGAGEADVRVWSAQASALVRNVLGDQRNWAFYCSGDLSPDPADAILRVVTMQRDALLELGANDQLSDEGIRELIATERQVEMMGGEEADLSRVPAIQRATATPDGTMTVSVHSPVSLHVYDESGGHVGWNSAANTSETTILGATYTGEPGGPQTITLPAGYYKVVVDELAEGTYLLQVATNGTGADAVEAFLSDSITGRTTSTHYAVTQGWDGERLDVFPVRRADTTASVSFRDEGRPSTTGGAVANDDRPSDTPPVGGAGEAGPDRRTPAPALPLVGLAFAMAAIACRRRRA